MKKYVALLVVLLLFSINAFADVRLPDAPKPTPKKTSVAKKETSVEFHIRVNSNVTEPVLRVPRSALKTMRAGLDGSADDTALATTVAKLPTVMSGLFLSLAIIFGGVWLARGKQLGKTGKLVASSLVIVFFSFAFAFTIYANVAPPPFQGLNGNIFSDAMKNHWNGAVGKVKVEITDENYDDAPIELIIPRDSKSATRNDEE